MSKRMLTATVVVLALVAFVGWWKVLSGTANADQSGRPSVDAQAQQSENTQSRLAEDEPKEMAEFLRTIGPAKSMTGVSVMPTFLIKGVLPGSPADIVGLKEGDLITNIDGHQADSFKVVLKMTRKEPGTPVNMDLLRYNPETGKYDYYKSTILLAPWQPPNQ
ncbi:MAG: PDZ domain-containing protein [Acidobacteriota bacterium]